MNRYRTLALGALAAFALAGCKRDAPPPATADAAPAVAAPAPAATPSAVISEINQNSPASAAPGFDIKAFAGNFEGAGNSLSISPDGSYTLSTRADSAGADLTTKGTWTIEPDGVHVLLDPESKEAADRRFRIVDNIDLREVDGTLVLTRGG